MRRIFFRIGLSLRSEFRLGIRLAVGSVRAMAFHVDTIDGAVVLPYEAEKWFLARTQRGRETLFLLLDKASAQCALGL